MDELTAVRELRRDLAGPDLATETDARQRLRATISGGRRPRRALLVPVTAAALVLAVVAGTAVVTDRASAPPARVGSGQAGSAAAAFLESMSRVAAAQDDARPADRPIWYVKRDASYLTLSAAEGERTTWRYLQHRRDWQVPGSTSRIVINDGKPTFFREQDRVTYDQMVKTTAGTMDTAGSVGLVFVLGEHTVGLADLDRLPSDDAKLAPAMADLAERMERPGDAGHAELVAQLLGGMPVRSAVRAALYRYLGTLPAKLLGEVRTADGRTGTGIAVADSEREVRLVVDDATSRLVAWEIRTLVPDPPVPAGAIVAYEAFHAQAWVATAGDAVAR